jgi:N-methylhydantoinase A/oxoprolinase/acetone carboxylase beta subunit
MPHAVAVDIGGTFTDLVAYDHDSRTVVYTKSLTTYGNLVEGVLDCFLKARLDPLVESGPIGGCIGAGAYAHEAARPDSAFGGLGRGFLWGAWLREK